MGWHNSREGYGALTKVFHWLIVVMFAFQIAAGFIMTRLGQQDTAFGIGPNAYYNWHKSIGLLALFVAVARLWARRAGELPPWAPTLSTGERAFIHRAEQTLYTAMFVMPISGFVYVMAGGFGVALFGVYDLPNPIGRSDFLAATGKWIHIVAGYVLIAALIGHIGLVLRHQFILKDGLLRRMLPRALLSGGLSRGQDR